MGDCGGQGSGISIASLIHALRDAPTSHSVTKNLSTRTTHVGLLWPRTAPNGARRPGPEADCMLRTEGWESLTIGVAVPVLLAQYALVYLAATSAHTHMPECIPRAFGGYREAFRAWDAGVCYTEEQLWCRAHPGKHPACVTADCRAEEVRLSLPGRTQSMAGLRAYMLAEERASVLREPVWAGCTAAQVDAIWKNFASTGSWQGACVPLGDKRSLFLRNCEVR